MGVFSLATACGDEMVQQLKDNAMDVSDNFMNGLDTAKYAATSKVANVVGKYNSIVEEAQTGIDNISANLDVAKQNWNDDWVERAGAALSGPIQKFFEDELKTYLDERKQDFIAQVGSIPSFLIQRTAYWYAQYMGDVMKEAVQDFYQDKMKKEEANLELMQQEAQKQMLNDTKNKVIEVTGKVTETTQLIYKEVENITKMVSAGPECIEKSVNQLHDKIIPPLKADIDNTLNTAYDELYAFMDNEANTAGKKMADGMAKATRNATKKALTLADKAKKKAISFAASALLKAKALVSGMTGVPLP